VVDLRQVKGWWSLTVDGEPLLGTANVGTGRGAPRLLAPPIAGFAASEELLHAVVTLEDLGVDALFVASDPLGVRLAPRGPLEARAELRTGRHRELRVDKPPGPIRYEFAARSGAPTYAELEAVGDPEVPRELAFYAAPGLGLSSEVHDLAVELTTDTTTRAQKVAAVMDHLASFEYTLDQPQSERVDRGADPIEGFLFETRAGHCEYFATAMALLLREAGVPTRIVNGYLGAHWNGLGEYYAVRQADAHSWIEVHFGPLGWVTFDPTPPAGRTAGDAAPLWPAAAQLLDALRNAYLDWIIDYNLGKQLALLEGLGVRRSGVERTRVAWRPLLIGFAAIMIALVVATRVRRRRRGGASRADTRVWEHVVRKLAARGHSPTPAESPRAFAARLAREGVAGSAAIAEFCALYEAIRFGAHESSGALERLRAAGRDAIVAISRRAVGHTRGP
jgi:transglutaminase-like putative cysteine protease